VPMILQNSHRFRVLYPLLKYFSLMRVLLLLLLSVCCWGAKVSFGGNTLEVDGKAWLTNFSLSVLSHGSWLSLSVASSQPVRGSDRLGTFSGESTVFRTSSGLKVLQLDIVSYSPGKWFVFLAQFRLKLFAGDMIRFSTRFLVRVVPQAPTRSERHSAYFVFRDKGPNVTLGQMTFQDQFGFVRVQQFSPRVFYDMGGQPTVLFEPFSRRTMIVSPLNLFQSQAVGSADGFSVGLVGQLSEIPMGTTSHALVVVGLGMNATFSRWGQALLAYGRKTPNHSFNRVVKYLQYYTDNGAYYWYNNATFANFEDVFAALGADFKARKIPVRAVQIDSWWYHKGLQGYSQGTFGVSSWTPMKHIFPNGISGALTRMNISGSLLGVVLHNKFFSPDNSYRNNYPFIIEKQMALPLTSQLYFDIMGIDVNGLLAVYEQDWLITQRSMINALNTNLSVPLLWFRNMNEAAEKRDISIQLCMPMGMHYLHSTLHDRIVTTRVSQDSLPSQDTTQGDEQWRIGYTSLLAHSIGLLPSKDNFWSADGVQDGCTRPGSCFEWNGSLQSLVATLSRGPVGFGDAVGRANRTRLMMTCREDGMILTPDKPATVLDSVFDFIPNNVPLHNQTFQFLDEVWATFTAFGPHRWYFVVAIDMKRLVNVTLNDLNAEEDLLVYNWKAQAVSGYLTASSPLLFDAQKWTPPNLVIPFEYIWLIPRVRGCQDLYFIGEIGKYVPVSNRRIVNVQDNVNTGLIVILTGSPEETVTLAVIASSKLVTFDCVLDGSGAGKFACMNDNNCNC
jgi:hypothetical protein